MKTAVNIGDVIRLPVDFFRRQRPSAVRDGHTGIVYRVVEVRELSPTQIGLVVGEPVPEGVEVDGTVLTMLTGAFRVVRDPEAP